MNFVERRGIVKRQFEPLSLDTARDHEILLEEAQSLMRDGLDDGAIARYTQLTNLTDVKETVLATAHFELAICFYSSADWVSAAQHYRLAAINHHNAAKDMLDLLIQSHPTLAPYSLDSYYGGSSFNQASHVDVDDQAEIQSAPLEDQQQSQYFAYDFLTSPTHKPVPTHNNPNLPENSLTNAKQLLNDGQFDQAKKMYRVLASKDTIVGQAACCQLSIMYKVGLGVDKNPAKAKAYLLRAAEKGNRDSYVPLGDMAFESGDYVACYEYYKKSGNESKINEITKFILDEAARLVRTKSVKPAHDLYLILANDDHIEALLHLGGMCMHYSRIKDHATAEKYLAKAREIIQSKQENTTNDKEWLRRSASLLGDLYSLQNKIDLASDWYALAHNNGDNDAALKLAQKLMNPSFFEKERPLEVIKWCTIAATEKKHTQINHEFIAWYENRPFWASKIEDPQQLQLVANFYIRAEIKLPLELTQFKLLSTNNSDT